MLSQNIKLLATYDIIKIMRDTIKRATAWLVPEACSATGYGVVDGIGILAKEWNVGTTPGWPSRQQASPIDCGLTSPGGSAPGQT